MVASYGIAIANICVKSYRVFNMPRPRGGIMGLFYNVTLIPHQVHYSNNIDIIIVAISNYMI